MYYKGRYFPWLSESFRRRRGKGKSPGREVLWFIKTTTFDPPSVAGPYSSSPSTHLSVPGRDSRTAAVVVAAAARYTAAAAAQYTAAAALQTDYSGT